MDKPNSKNERRAELSLPKLLVELADQVRAHEHTAHTAAVAMQVTDQLLRACTQQIAVNCALRKMLYRTTAAIDGRDIGDVEAEYLRTEAEEYERVLLDFGEDNPRLAEFLDTRPTEQRT